MFTNKLVTFSFIAIINNTDDPLSWSTQPGLQQRYRKSLIYPGTGTGRVVHNLLRFKPQIYFPLGTLHRIAAMAYIPTIHKHNNRIQIPVKEQI